ncbi:MAG TPA: hypothetical protein VHC44_18225 [Verrucomicrobiae bacterium]|nr:hypothetical protein [Verrucomicrobiae bacterium]
MKTRIATFAIVVFVAQCAIAQTPTNFLFRNRFPILNDSLRCDLAPLYAWWANQLDAKTNVQSAGDNDAGGSGDATNSSNRPMAPWVHITGEILNKDEPQGWVVNAVVETAPGKGVPRKIILIHPPRKELERFGQKINLLNSPLPQPDYSALEAEIKTQNNRAFVADTIGDWDLEDTYLAAAADAKQRLAAQKERDQSLADQRVQALAALGDFPADWQMYRVDLFAFNSGRQIKGLPAFDAGLSFSN